MSILTSVLCYDLRSIMVYSLGILSNSCFCDGCYRIILCTTDIFLTLAITVSWTISYYRESE